MSYAGGATISRPVYVVVADQPREHPLAASLGVPADHVLDTDTIEQLRELTPGLVLVPRDEGGDRCLLDVADVLADKPGWQLAVVEGPGNQVRTVALSRRKPLIALEAPSDGQGGETMSSRIRHGINNHLTSALAETQLLLLDLEPGEVRTACETIQSQLEAISKLVRSTKRSG